MKKVLRSNCYTYSTCRLPLLQYFHSETKIGPSKHSPMKRFKLSCSRPRNSICLLCNQVTHTWLFWLPTNFKSLMNSSTFFSNTVLSFFSIPTNKFFLWLLSVLITFFCVKNTWTRKAPVSSQLCWRLGRERAPRIWCQPPGLFDNGRRRTFQSPGQNYMNLTN